MKNDTFILKVFNVKKNYMMYTQNKKKCEPIVRRGIKGEFHSVEQFVKSPEKSGIRKI